MILDTLDSADRYAALHPRFKEALDYLRRDDLRQLPDGRHAIDEDRLWVIIERIHGRGREAARLEAHQRHIDIQFVVDGEEQIGWMPTGDCRQIDQPYDMQRDVGFFGDTPRTWLTMRAGTLAVFYPEDAHAPLAGRGSAHKAVIKVLID